MSKEATRDLIERYFAAFNDHSIEGMLACLHEDVAHDVNQGERRIGLASFKEFSIHMERSYREQLSDMVIMVSEDGNRAAAEFTVRGEYLATDEGLPPADGQTYSLPAGTFFEIDDGKISRVTTYYNLKDWIAQVENAE
ncbi:hypothetical protein E2A64_12765 [Pseudohoeflea suaedae]|uniref:SnoaL-like domain-containing protein n=1 Tax=Pseudohoeflea suaedae TaxID=877384 RepID=A0A4R5PKJ1_9HYPH|nr:ketosteroid isomerase-related protein [Pseudohoeflea suaedae]TDH36156.1 hypothetical protein E2A64_12765 [Pseudohoeflea suaedae]